MPAQAQRRSATRVAAMLFVLTGAAAAVDYMVTDFAPPRENHGTSPPRSQAANSVPPVQRLKLDWVDIELPGTIEPGEGVEPGDEVVTVRDALLRAENRKVACLPRGTKLTVQHVAAERLLVQNDRCQGWTARTSVIRTTLARWYADLPDLAPVDLYPESCCLAANANGIVRTKIHGVWFELRRLPSGESPYVFFNSRRRAMGVGTPPSGNATGETVRVLDKSGSSFVVQAKGHEATVHRNSIFVAYRAVAFVVEKQSDRSCTLRVNARSYGLVRPGDFVVIDAAEKVLVNGRLRSPTL